MPIERDLHDLLRDHDCVIVPRFGGFLTHYRPARIDVARALLHGGDLFGIFLIAANITMGSMEERSVKADAIWVSSFSVAARALFP